MAKRLQSRMRLCSSTSQVSPRSHGILRGLAGEASHARPLLFPETLTYASTHGEWKGEGWQADWDFLRRRFSGKLTHVPRVGENLPVIRAYFSKSQKPTLQQETTAGFRVVLEYALRLAAFFDQEPWCIFYTTFNHGHLHTSKLAVAVTHSCRHCP